VTQITCNGVAAGVVQQGTVGLGPHRNHGVVDFGDFVCQKDLGQRRLAWVLSRLEGGISQRITQRVSDLVEIVDNSCMIVLRTEQCETCRLIVTRPIQHITHLLRSCQSRLALSICKRDLGVPSLE